MLCSMSLFEFADLDTSPMEMPLERVLMMHLANCSISEQIEN
jgi:hypothetical protein